MVRRGAPAATRAAGLRIRPALARPQADAVVRGVVQHRPEHEGQRAQRRHPPLRLREETVQRRTLPRREPHLGLADADPHLRAVAGRLDGAGKPDAIGAQVQHQRTALLGTIVDRHAALHRVGRHAGMAGAVGKRDVCEALQLVIGGIEHEPAMRVERAGRFHQPAVRAGFEGMRPRMLRVRRAHRDTQDRREARAGHAVAAEAERVVAHQRGRTVRPRFHAADRFDEVRGGAPRLRPAQAEPHRRDAAGDHHAGGVGEIQARAVARLGRGQRLPHEAQPRRAGIEHRLHRRAAVDRQRHAIADRAVGQPRPRDRDLLANAHACLSPCRGHARDDETPRRGLPPTGHQAVSRNVTSSTCGAHSGPPARSSTSSAKVSNGSASPSIAAR